MASDVLTTRPAARLRAGSVIDQRYRVTRVLRRADATTTLLADDLDDQRPVVVKVRSTERTTPVLEALADHEAHVLSTLDSPHIVSLLDVGKHEGALYFVTPAIDGTTLAELLERRVLTAHEALSVGADLFRALADAHGHGVLHRDVKPSNLLVRSSADTGTIDDALLIDFGLAWSRHLDRAARDEAVGTVRYMSPEAAGSIGATPDERSDLYSAGISLFESLAGTAPFDGTTVGELLRQHLSVPPPELRSLGVDVPRALDEVVQRLLRKDPEDRYATAWAVVEDLEDIAAALARGNADPRLVVGHAERRATLTEPVFVGREPELRQLREALDAATEATPRFVQLEAPSGGGKSRLLAEFTREVVRSGSLLLQGQGVDQAAPRPFQLLTGVATDVLELASADGQLAADLGRHVDEQAQGVVDALPVLRELLTGSSAERLGPEEHGETRSVRALARLLHALGKLEQPVVIVLDDCQWADELTLKVLAEWWTRHADSGRLTVVAAFRSEEVDADHPLRRIPGTRSLELPPLDDEALRDLARSMAGELPQDALDTVVRLCGGSPFMASAVLRGMVESGALRHGSDGWETVPDAMTRLSSSRHAAMVLARRIRLLSEQALGVLRVGAVLGKQFDLTLVSDLLQVPLSHVITGLGEPTQRHILWLRPEDGRAVFAHDKLRETVLSLLDDDERRTLHLDAALRLEQRDASRVFELAYHFDAAGEPDRALPYALDAADQARAQHSLEVAADQYAIARRGARAGDVASQYRIAIGSGEVAMLRGRYDDAEEEFSSARSSTDDPRQLATIEGRLGELAFKRGDSDEAARRTESALRSLGRRVPTRLLGYLLCVFWEVLVQAAHTLLSSRLVGRRPLEDSEDDLLAVRLYSRLAHAYWFSRGSVPTAWAHLREMNIAERYPPTLEVAQAYSEHAPVMTLLTWFDRGIRYVRRSLEIRRELGDVWGQGQSLHFYGVVLYGASRYQECIDRCSEAIRVLERTGDQWEINTARWHIAYSEYRLGRLSAALETAGDVHRSGVTIGDTQARGISLSVWSKANDGRVPGELLEREIEAISGDVHTGAEVLQAEAIRLLAEGDLDGAEHVLLRARRMVRRKLAMQEYVAPVFVWLVTVRRKRLEAIGPWAPGRRREALRRARRAAWMARLVSSRYRNNLPHALRESGLIAAASGRTSRADRWLERSLRTAQSQGAEAERARTLIARGRVRAATGAPGADHDVEEGARRLAALTADRPGADAGDGHSISLLDRFDTVLDAGRRLAAALTLPAIHAEAHDAARTLLRGDRCAVLARESEHAAWCVVYGDEDVPWSTSLIHRAVHEGRAVSFDGGAADRTGQSLLLRDVRSGLCVPVHARGRTDVCLLITNQPVGGVYGEDERRLAEFIGTIAGAAIENAHWFHESMELTRSLESKVADRTAELDSALHREQAARTASDRRAQLLGALAAAGRAMTSLDPDQVLTSVVDTATGIGFTAAEVCVLEDDERTYRVTHGRGLAAGYVRSGRSADEGLVGRVVRERRTVSLRDYGDLRDADPTVLGAGVRAAVASPLWSDGELVGVLIAGDRTRRDVSQDELEAFELLAVQAGRALDNARDYQREQRTVERLAIADRLKDEFLERVSHELRTPLTVISGMATILDARWDQLHETRRSRDLVRRIDANSRVLMDIITTLLDFSNLRRGALEPQPQDVDLSRLLQQLIDRLADRFVDHDVTVELARGLVVRADPKLLDRAVENLLTNAAKYTEPGTRVELRADVADGSVEVRVSDDGPGIPSEYVERLTDRFFRGEGAGTRPTRGLGLGLAFTDEVLRLHGSRLRIESVEGHGSTFRFHLPMARSAH